MIDLSKHLTESRVLDLAGTTKSAVLAELTASFAGAPEVHDPDALLRAILEREAIVSTGIGLGVAIPHAKIPGVTDFVLAYGRSSEGVPFDAIDDQPVHHFVMIAGPPDQQQRYLRFLALLTRKLKDPVLRASLAAAADPATLRRTLCDSPGV